MTETAIILLSGGIDSTTLLHTLPQQKIIALYFDYNQSLQREKLFARENARRRNAEFCEVYLDLSATAPECLLFEGRQTSALAMNRTKEDIAVGGTPPSYVPFRNGVFFAWAVAYGEGHGIRDIYCGGNGLFSGNYWDDTLGFAEAMETAARVGTAPMYNPRIRMPFAMIEKHEIVSRGMKAGVDYTATYSCYLGEERHCGECDSCVQRLEAFAPFGLDIEGRDR